VLEIGSGSGQHAVHFGTQIADIHWQPSDRGDNLPGIHTWLDDAGLDNVAAPLRLDVCQHCWPATDYQAVFSANTAHIMDWPAVTAMFQGVSRLLPPTGLFLLYGPFRYAGEHSSPSNARFDQWLKQRDPDSGVRDLDDLQALAADNALTLQQDIAMPVNNRVLVWQKQVT